MRPDEIEQTRADHDTGDPGNRLADLLLRVASPLEYDESADHRPVEALPGQQVAQSNGRPDGHAHLDRWPARSGDRPSVSANRARFAKASCASNSRWWGSAAAEPVR